MWTNFSAFSILICLNFFVPISRNKNSYQPSCNTELDSLTKKVIYTSADVLPQNEGGQISLLRSFVKIKTENNNDDYSLTLLVAFIVDTSGIITGERILKGNTETGKQILDIVKSLKWKPAKCSGKDVAMLYKLPLIIDTKEE